MHNSQQQMPLFRQLEQTNTNRNIFAQVERFSRFGDDNANRLGLTFAFRQML